MTDARSPSLSVEDRRVAMREAWKRMQEGELERRNTRDALVSIAMAHANDEQLRVEALRLLFSDEDPSADEANERVAVDMLPHEPSAEIVRFLGGTAVDRNWQETVPSFVRSYTRPSEVYSDLDRPERQILQLLRPKQSVEQTIFDVFLHPPQRPEVPGINWAERTRADAWGLLTRLDNDGSIRASILGSPSTGAGSRDDAVVNALRACWNDLGCVPVTGEELAWLLSLAQPDSDHVRWWTQAASAIAGINDDRRLALKLYHAEPLRYTARARVDRFNQSKTSLLSELRGRINQRSTYRRSEREQGKQPPADDRLSTWQDKLAWADVIALMAIDDAISDDDVRKALFSHAELDHSDETTEYGGILRPSENAPDTYVSVLYPPRPAHRRGDDVFVASSDMIEQSDHALAHFHFHVQRWSNRGYAGPSWGDLEYALRHGRICVVFTGISRDELDVDVYFPSSEVVDLGSIRRRD
ncbi:MAG: hypothetical protein H6815_10115 [Phycisphaeraceae bacterium]|nr:hypothetical protein [Phycisphaerales bacterium]MCB9860793.1 hypothetical protein [Phycisphaeraceae bacterium]